MCFKCRFFAKISLQIGPNNLKSIHFILKRVFYVAKMFKIQTEVFEHEVSHGATEFSFFCQIEMAMMQRVAIFVDFLTEIEVYKSTKLLYIFRCFNKQKLEIALNNNWKWCIVFRFFLSRSGTHASFNFPIHRWAIHLQVRTRSVDLHIEYLTIWRIMSPNGWYLKHHHFKFRSHGKLTAKNILLGAKLVAVTDFFFLLFFYQTNFHVTVLHHFWLHGNMFFFFIRSVDEILCQLYVAPNWTQQLPI